MTSTTLNLAFVGSGAWARRYHFPALAFIREQMRDRFDLRLRGIFSLDTSQAQAMARVYGIERVYDSLDALREDADLSAIAVAVTPQALKGVIDRLIPCGLPLFSEKPPGISAQEAAYLAEQVAVPNVVAFNRRYIPLNQRFKEIVAAMQGIYFVAGHFLRHAREDEAFVIGTGVHWINYMEYLFGPITEVQVEHHPNPQNDTYGRLARLRFSTGLPGLLKIIPCTGSQHERVEVHSNDQSAYLDGPLWETPGSILIERGTERTVIAPEAGSSDAADTPLTRGIVDEYVDFFSAVCYGTPTRSNFQNAVNTMRVAEIIEGGPVQPGEMP